MSHLLIHLDFVHTAPARGPLCTTVEGLVRDVGRSNRDIGSHGAHPSVVSARLGRERELEAQPFARAPAVPGTQERARVKPARNGGRVRMHMRMRILEKKSQYRSRTARAQAGRMRTTLGRH